ncbi:unnamed protein product [Rotaria magnacalcarata]|uniref:Uncharacterized protein n=3 Tax=Rotaria magnacalcarata TaxID=392030 RepID=A0A815TPW1_9BILA|nr:unnamed protein product [Rotaria magnacalcarata]CAF1639635.1 unnamed protein product [Rotaria magnacalcarata]CAF2053299.1 unnamed protein product [Rotaria magnacalcarata]CAF2091686.1 unnamed protein product [Rotaria magnacalcarata]CAF2146289.1 unnamed protein product [Rotaria magnacalcarata]
MLTQYEYDNISSQKSCYSSDTNATVSAIQRYLTAATTTAPSSISSSRIQNSPPEIQVQSSTKEFLAKHFHDAYPMFKKPRGLCLIINVYNINGAIRRWSDLDVKLLSDLFRQLYFNVIVYSDFNGDDLGAENFMKILKQFSQSKEHVNAQCCIICLMSHGEEGSLTVQDGKKIYHDHVFDLFSNVNCPNLAGKPKLFFIQCCRDDPGVGPVDDAGCHVQIPLNASLDDLVFDDECDSMQRHHLPTMTDMLIAFPSQKGFTAFRKPHVGSWYMNALVDVLARHAKDTDLCSMLNMVNGCVSREVTNKGKKQTAEYKSSFTKKAFYFFPGLTGNPMAPIDYSIHNRNDVNRIGSISRINNIDHQHDSSSMNFDIIKTFFIGNLLDKWKNLARELDVNENDIDIINRENVSPREKFSLILDIVAKTRDNNLRQILIDMLKSLQQCRRMSYYYQLQQMIAPYYPDLQ